MLHIVVPTDFSPAAVKAAAFAVHVAERIPSTVTFLNIYQIPVASARNTTFTDPAAAQQSLNEGEHGLKKFVAETAGLDRISYTTKLIPMQWVAELPELIHAQKPDLVIMGTNGASALKGIFFGTNTAKVLETAPGPVIAVPVDAQCSKIGTVAFAYDKEYAGDLSALDFIRWMVKRFHADLDVFHVNTDGQEEETAEQQINKEQLKEYLQGLRHEYNEVPGDHVEEEINKYLHDKNIDLLAMLRRSRGLFDRLFKKSFTTSMAYLTSTPLLVIPERS